MNDKTNFSATSETEIVQDLNRLEEFVLSLEPLASLSEAIAKLHRLCQVLLIIARLYTEAKAKYKAKTTRAKMANPSQSNYNANEVEAAEIDNENDREDNGYETDGNQNNGNVINKPNNNSDDTPTTDDLDLVLVGQEFDLYLSALGFVPDYQGSSTAGGGIMRMGIPGSVDPASGSNGFGLSYPGAGMGMNTGSGSGSGSGIGFSNANNADTADLIDTDMMEMTQQPSSSLSSSDRARAADNSEQQENNLESVPAVTTGQLSPPSVLQSMQLGNWFSGNRYMMGLLEEDLSQLPSSWGVS